jgi:RNA polymerase sigma-70 factor (ECF subfamily)
VQSEPLHIFEILAKQHEPMLLAYIMSLISDRQLAEDIAQETLIVAYRSISTLKKPDSFGAWLRGIARLKVLTAIRKRGTEIPFEPAVLEGVEDVFQALEQNGATERWEERFQLVQDCFEKLPERLQQVCRLHYFEDKPTRDIAQVLHLALGAVLKRLERARDAIRDCVQKRLRLEA